MFKSHYQGGAHVEIFSAQGKDPAAKWKQSGKVQRIFDKSIKSYVYLLEGGPATKMQIPRDERQGLSLTQHFLVLQLSVPLGVGFNVQILATDTLNSKRRIFLSSAHKDISHTPLHTRLPLGMMVRGQWVNLAINIGSIITSIFNSTLKSTELICVSASCKLRKVFTMRHQPHNTMTGIYSPAYDGPSDTIPKPCTLNIGTVTQVIDMAVMRQWVENQQPKIQRETVTKSAPQNPVLRAKPIRNAHSAENNRRALNSSLETPSKQKAITKKPRKQQPVAAFKPEPSPRAESLNQERTVDQATPLATATPLVTATPRAAAAPSATDSPVKHSTPNPLMDRVLDLSFGTGDSPNIAENPASLDDLDNNSFEGNKNLIENITNGNVTFRSSSSNTSKTSSTASRKSPSHTVRSSRHSTRRSRDSNRCSQEKVYNSKDYEDENPFAASDEDLKYRMKALALYNGDLDDSMDFSTTSRKSKRSMGVGPGATQSDEEVEEKLGEDTDTSSSDATVLSHAQAVLLSESVGHTSFLQDSIGKTHENRLTDRAYSPPICYPDELTRQATLPQHHTSSTIEEDSEGEEELDLLYDPVLNCYFDPKTCKYYELA